MGDFNFLFFIHQPSRRASLTPPPESKVTWKEYISAEPGGHPILGREIQYKESTKAFRATLAMVSFSFSIISIWPVFFFNGR